MSLAASAPSEFSDSSKGANSLASLLCAEASCAPATAFTVEFAALLPTPLTFVVGATTSATAEMVWIAAAWPASCGPLLDTETMVRLTCALAGAVASARSMAARAAATSPPASAAFA